MAPPGSDLPLKIGQTVEAQDGREGVIAYIGPLHIAAGQWLGLQLEDQTGKNDGSVKGERYFTCRPGHGIFVRKESVLRIVRQGSSSGAVGSGGGGRAGIGASSAGSAARTNGAVTAGVTTNGSTTKARPISGSGTGVGGVSAEVARKRQSLMSAGSGVGGGAGGAVSRLSVRSNTKSPTKTVVSSASSNASTPRTVTPATTTARSSDSTVKSRLSLAGKPPVVATRGPTTSRPGANTSRPSIGGTVRESAVRSGVAQTQPSRSREQPTQARIASRPSLDNRRLKEKESLVKSPTIQEDHEEEGEENDEDEEDENGTERASDQDEDSSEDSKHPPRSVNGRNPTMRKPSLPEPDPIPAVPPSPTVPRSRTVSIARSTISNTAEARATQQRELEQLKAKVKIMEQKREEDRDKIKTMDTLQSDRDRFENIIQALQRKMKSHQQDMGELKARCEVAEDAATKDDGKSAELESELELATLDREMAEERAETLQLELEALKTRHEELELESDILREENRELAAVMSPEEKASAGWLQMERETERLRQALIMLRDMSQQNEGELRKEIKELRRSVDDAESTSVKYDEVTEKLRRFEDTNRHLMQQLEAAETNDEVVEAMEMQREQSLATIDKLKKQIQDLEEHIQVTDELELFHVEEEKRLHSQLDESEGLLSEKIRLTFDQERSIEDLEYTLSKFRDVVQSLQNDIDEMRRSREISENEAHEMSSKSRAMMELNMQLQNSAAKTQLKTIDLEMGKIRAEEANLHLEIMQHFVMGSYVEEQKPVLALLAFKRIKSKSTLVRSLLTDRLKDRPTLIDDPFALLRTVEMLTDLAGRADRFIFFLMTCPAEDFMQFESVVFDLEPVEKTLDEWIDALRRDELAVHEDGHLKRMLGIVYDIAGKLVHDTPAYTSMSVIAHSSMIECFMDSANSLLLILLKTVQAKLGFSESEDDESFTFDKKMNQLAAKIRTVKYVSNRMRQTLLVLQSRSVLPSDDQSFYSEMEGMEVNARHISHVVSFLCKFMLDYLNDDEHDETPTYASLIEAMTEEIQDPQLLAELDAEEPVDAVHVLAGKLQTLHKDLDRCLNFSLNTESLVEFGSLPRPWVARVKVLKAQKVISRDVEEELTALKRQNQESIIRLSERDKQVEEQQIRIELLEARKKETKVRDESIKAMKRELDSLQIERDELAAELEQNTQALENLQQDHSTQEIELESLRNSQKLKEDIIVAGPADALQQAYLRAEIDLVRSELISLQACVRYLRAENHDLRVPPSEIGLAAMQTSWLHPFDTNRRKENSTTRQLRTESTAVFEGLIELAQTAKPISLKSRAITSEPGPSISAIKPTRAARISTRHQALKQREEFEIWSGRRDDLVQQARLVSGGEKPFSRRKKIGGVVGYGSKRLQFLDSSVKGELTSGGNSVEFVNST